LEKYSHPPSSSNLKAHPELQQEIIQEYRDLVEKQYLDSIADLRNKIESYQREIEKLREENMKQETITQKHLDLVEKQYLDSVADLRNTNESFQREIEKLREENMEQETITQKHLDLVEKQFRDSIMDLQNKNEYYERQIEKLREEKMKMATYHQQLEHALGKELDNRERREIEHQKILAVKRDTPSHWGINALSEMYREIDIRPNSPEFAMVSDLLNDTIENHGNNYGTIYGKDPTEFIVTKVTRIHNKKLWHQYCFKKVNRTVILNSLQ
jgi:chromosome segregation ATPase